MARLQTDTRSRGTRSSARLRGTDDGNSDWQQIPDAWLEVDVKPVPTPADDKIQLANSARSLSASRPVGSDEESELTELTELSDDDASPDIADDSAPDDVTAEKEQSPEEDEGFSVPEGFIEWETVS
jgi:hypothetical protein